MFLIDELVFTVLKTGVQATVATQEAWYTLTYDPKICKTPFKVCKHSYFNKFVFLMSYWYLSFSNYLRKNSISAVARPLSSASNKQHNHMHKKPDIIFPRKLHERS
jgi:hypothetical protein